MLRKLYFLWKQRAFWRLAKRGPEEIFTEVYKSNAWGGKEGDFFSGAGSVNPNTEIYIKNLVGFIHKHPVKRVVELGCGDFRIMQKVLDQTKIHYLGLDIVKPLIDFNTKKFGTDLIRFQHSNIINDVLPEGDLVLIRQVLQHLGNSEIAKILEKISTYPWALITEHLPISGQINFNVDKIHGPHIRMNVNSGVFIDQPPFKIKNSKVLFEYREDARIKGEFVPAVTRTHLISNERKIGIPAHDT